MSNSPSNPKGTRDFLPSELSKRNYIIDILKNNFKNFGFSEIEKRFEPRDVDTNEWTLFCQQQRIPDFPHKNTNANTKNSSHLKSPARRYVCDALLLERFRCVAFFPRGAVFEHRARFFFVRAILVREQNE